MEAFDGGKTSMMGPTPMYVYVTEVYELVAPEGTVFVMQSAPLRVGPANIVDKLPTLGERLSLPDGWTCRARTLGHDLVMPATYDSDPPNMIVLDEFENNYQRLITG